MWRIEVFVKSANGGKGEWQYMSGPTPSAPNGYSPYIFATHKEAHDMKRICYPGSDASEVRIVETK